MTTTPNTTKNPWTIAKLLNWTTDYFEKQNVDDPRLSTEVLLAHSLECNRIDLYARFEVQPTDQQTTKFRALIKRAANHEPIAYLVGEKEFFSLAFHVTSDVLIPRGETETLVERAIEHCTTQDIKNPTILDMGTGTACIPIAILSNLKDATAVASDISPAALDIAKQNADRHNLTDRLTFIEADRLNLPADTIPEGGFDIILSNPPYVPLDEMKSLDKNVRDHEPHTALTDRADGLSFYKTIAENAAKILKPNGLILVEIADGQEQHVRDTMTKSNHWKHAGTWRDNVTSNPRVLAFSRIEED